MNDDAYAALGVRRDATHKEIVDAYRKQAKKLHPDRTRGDEGKTERFKSVGLAYELIGTEEARAQYNFMHPAKPSAPEMFGIPRTPQYAAETGVKRPRASSSYNEEEMNAAERMFWDQMRSGDLGSFFRQPQAPAPAPPPVKKRKETKKVWCTLEQLYTGHAVQCEGATVVIPPGAPDNWSKTYSVQSIEEDEYGRPVPRKLQMKIGVREHALYKREGNDLSMRVHITMKQALCGGEVDVPTIDGKMHKLVLAGITYPNSLKIVQGKGLPAYGGVGCHGVLKIGFVVEWPKSLGDKQRFQIDQAMSMAPVEYVEYAKR